MSLTYVVPDLHGRLDIFLETLNLIEADHATQTEPCTVVFLGDYIDRGIDGSVIIMLLRAGPPAASGQRWICLLGNHEDMMLDASRGKNVNMWLANGGKATLVGYGHPIGADLDLEVLPPHDLAWLRSLPLWYQDLYRVYVHAGVLPHTRPAENGRHDLIWMRYGRPYVEWEHDPGEKWLVHGHDADENGPIIHEGRVQADIESYYTGRIAVTVYDDAVPGPPVRILIAQLRDFGEYSKAERARRGIVNRGESTDD